MVHETTRACIIKEQLSLCTRMREPQDMSADINRECPMDMRWRQHMIANMKPELLGISLDKIKEISATAKVVKRCALRHAFYYYNRLSTTPVNFYMTHVQICWPTRLKTSYPIAKDAAFAIDETAVTRACKLI